MENIKKTALITGGSRGIGRAIIQVLTKNEVTIIAPARAELDVSSEQSIRNYTSHLSSEIHILINCAGINPLAKIGELDFEKGRHLMDANYWGPVLLTHLLAERMKKQKYGRIVNISSIWSVISKEGRSIYASSKAAINSFTRSAAVELAPYNILVNALAPGFVNTELTKINNSTEQLNLISTQIPLKRMAEPHEIAELVYFLCSDKNTYLTGQTIIADGGFSIV